MPPDADQPNPIPRHGPMRLDASVANLGTLAPGPEIPDDDADPMVVYLGLVRKGVDLLEQRIFLLRDVLRSLPHCSVFVVDHNQKVLACGGEELSKGIVNPEAPPEDQVHFNPDVLEGRQIGDVLPSGNDGVVAKAYRRAINGESGYVQITHGDLIYGVYYAPLMPRLSGVRGAVTLSLVQGKVSDEGRGGPDPQGA